MSNQLIREVEQPQARDDLTAFTVGDTIRVHFKIIEGKTERVQVYEGICIGIRGKGLARTCMVRKISYGVGVERVFPLHSPKIARIEVVRRGRVRRAKLYYLRDRVGKAAKVKELIGSRR
jgi:large subunit ribosomal protein L19